MIRRKGNDKWIEIWQSKYKDKDFKPILTKAKDATHDIYTACLAYTNNMIKFKIDSGNCPVDRTVKQSSLCKLFNF